MVDVMVSAVVTTHNRLDLVRMAIKSVQSQTYPHIELIVVDDASEETSHLALVEQAEKEGFQYIYIPKKDSRGGNYARNQGILASHGKYIALLDDDDEWIPEKIEKQLAYVESHTDCHLVACLRLCEIDFTTREPDEFSKFASGDFRERIFERMLYTSSSLLIEKETLLAIGMFDEDLRFWQDFELLIRLCQVSTLGAVPEHLMLYRVIHKDKNRLTNNLDGWDKAVAYINEKHADRIATLPKKIQRCYKVTIAIDGIKRARMVGDTKRCLRYMRNLYLADPLMGILCKRVFQKLFKKG